ncbi:hypothetical protein K8354_09645 [Polaribacter litorisediminis]|uniref:hypothetical protein n=1 Tax=Polaribacter litorisediminis TaxID=1908341 RepID=UPI001CBF699A|nr:hypothetical protein [Polaribacter litorisediminis]UAM96605.1 hypothetical protein K8354_09645 [Polaribacter litorisediminis]
MKYIFLSVFVYAFASIFLKLGALSMGAYNLLNIIHNYFYLFSICCLFIHALLWQLALKSNPLNVAYAIKTIYYPILLGVSYFVFDESISLYNIIGTILILFGVYKLYFNYK